MMAVQLSGVDADTVRALRAFLRPPRGSSALDLSDTLVRELIGADHVLIASPLYNLSVPSTLKAYLDHVVRAGITFEMGKDGFRGLLKDTAATLVTARGGAGTPGDAGDFQTGYLRAILAFVGIGPVHVIALDGTALGDAAREKGQDRARRQIDQLFREASAPRWLGPFDEDDEQQITRLRRAQAAASVAGDAEAYAELCTDDVRLLIPGRDVISGRESFLDAERALFARASFSSFEKYPLSVERDGETAVEIGRQEATTGLPSSVGGVFSARQKYVHILRRTPAGWRFAVLMSNPCEGA